MIPPGALRRKPWPPLGGRDVEVTVMPDDIELRLARNDAIVLFELLSRFGGTKQLEVADRAEAQALWNLCCHLEEQLSEPFAADYQDILRRARDEIRPPGTS